MPGTSNPVSSTPHGVPQSKSFRTRLGFGSGGGPSTKPSFFSFKPGRKSFGGSGELNAVDRPVLAIDIKSGHTGARHDNGVVLNEATEPSQPNQSPVRSNARNSTQDSPLSHPTHLFSHSLPASPIDTHSALPPFKPYVGAESHMNKAKALPAVQHDPEESDISKHLPDLSANFSLLMNEPSLDIESQSDFQGSQTSSSQPRRSVWSSLRRTSSTHVPLPTSSPAALENQDQTQRWNLQRLVSVHQLRTIASLPPGVALGGPEASESAVSGFTNIAVENASASFDLSSAKLSLDLMRRSIGADWAKSLVAEGSASPSLDASGVLGPQESSVIGSRSGPVTSTPFLSPCVSPSQPQDADPDISFHLDALDPDLVALLRPNHYNHESSQINRIITPSPLESFAPPPDPLNPDTAAERLSLTPQTSSSSSPARRQGEGLAPSPVRKYATLSVSTSPSRSLRIPRSYTIQDILPRASDSSIADRHPDLPHLQTQGHDRRPPPSPALTYSSEAYTPLDASKHPNPLSVQPLTLDDLKRTRDPSPAQSSSASISNSITMRRIARTAVSPQIQSPRPVSILTSSSDSRPTPRYAPRNRDRELKPTSASVSPNSPGPSSRNFGSVGRERERMRPSMDGLFPAQSPDGSAGRPSSAGAGRPSYALHTGPSSNGVLPSARERDCATSTERRYRKRSMSLDQSGGFERRAKQDPHRQVDSNLRIRDHDRLAEPAGYGGSEFGYGTRGGLGAPYDGRDPDRDRDRYRYGYGYGDRERYGRPHTDWLGPRTVKAFAAAGLLDDPREAPASRYGNFSRSASEREVRTPGVRDGRERVNSVSGGFPSGDGERDRGHFRCNLTSSVRSGSDREFRSSGLRAGVESPNNTVGVTRPPSRGESWSHPRSAPLFTRTMSDLMSHRGSADGRESVSTMLHRTGSVYSAGGGGTGGGSTGSGGGRASPTTSSYTAAQSQIQALKDKHDAQTEALLGALADSQRTSKELREENNALKAQVRALEERLVDAITSSRQKDKELARTIRARLPHTPDRTRTVPSRHHANLPDCPHLPTQPKPLARSTPSPTKRRLSTCSSVFPNIPGSMSLLMAETPGSPPQGSLGSGSSQPPSPTLVQVKPAPRQKSSPRQDLNGYGTIPLPTPQPIPISHKRSTSGASMATSANFSFETGSPGSLKLKPEHELLLGDMTRLSLVTGFGGDSEAEG